MKEHKSHMSMVARFAYIFATIVTIFAQMGLAPLIGTQAVTNSVTVDKTEYHAGDTVTLSVTGTNDDNFYLTYDTSVLNFVGKVSTYGGTVTDKADNSRTAGHIKIDPWNASPYWPAKLTFTVKAGITNATANISQTDLYFRNPSNSAVVKVVPKPVTTPVPGGLQITSLDNKTTFNINDQVNLQLRDDLSKKPATSTQQEVGIGSHMSKYLVFDSGATATLLKSRGYDVQSGSATDANGQQYVPGGTSGTVKIYSYVKTDKSANDFQIWEYPSGEIHFVWSNGVTTTQTGMVAMSAESSTALLPGGVATLTPTYLSSTDSSLGTTDGSGLNITINPDPTVDATQLSMAPEYAAPFDTGAAMPPYLSDFPFFYMEEQDPETKKDVYSFVAYTNYSTADGGADVSGNDMLTLRKGVVAKLPFSDFKVTAASSNSSRLSAFENFHEIAADGSIVPGTQQQLSPGVTYTLHQYNPLSTTDPTRYKRIDTTWASKDWYMPDGIPTFSVSADGKITLHDTDKAAGKSIPNTWSVNTQDIDTGSGIIKAGTQIINKFYHVKKVRVVDQFNKPVNGVTLTMKNSLQDTSMTGKTDDVTGAPGDLFPSDFKSTENGPFYWANGDESFVGLEDLPSGYSLEGLDFSGLSLDPSTDYLKLDKTSTTYDGHDAATITNSDDTNFKTNQVLTLRVHKFVDADKNVIIKKVDQSDPTKVLSGAQFKIEELNNTSDPLNTAPESTDANGLLTKTVEQDSRTQDRLFHITETQAPTSDKYLIGNSNGYYAKWKKGTGFTAVGMTQDTVTGTTSSDKLAKVENGQLVIADPVTQTPGGGDSGMKIQYVDSARFNDSTNTAGTTISGAKLPVLNPKTVYTGTGTDTTQFKGLGGIIYTPGTTTSFPKTAETMTGSTQTSDKDGYGIIQSLWSTDGLVSNWKDLFPSNSIAYVLRNAIATNTIPTSPAIKYQLLADTDQQKQATATPASGYYNLGSTLVISGNGTVVKVQNAATGAKYSSKYRDNPVQKDNTGNTAKIQLYKVKHVYVEDTAGKPVNNVSVNFASKDGMTGMTATTGKDGTGSLAPTDGTFIFPNDAQLLQSVKQGDTAMVGADGSALTSTNGFSFSIADGQASTDKISAATTGKNVSISPDGQTVNITVQAPTTITIHKQSKDNAATSLAGATFKVWADGDEANAVNESTATNSDGNTTVTLPKPATNNHYYIKEVKAPSTPTQYALDPNKYGFTWTAQGQVTAVDDTTTPISKGTNGALNFADAVANNPITIKKVNTSNTALSGAQFTLTESNTSGTPLNSAPMFTQTTGSDGLATFEQSTTSADQHFYLLHETVAPAQYARGDDAVIGYKDGKVNVVLPGPKATTLPLTMQADGSLTYTDQLAPMPDRTIQVRKVVKDGTTPTLSVVNKPMQATLTSVNDSTKKYTLNVDASTGNATISESNVSGNTWSGLAKAMGYSGVPDPSTPADTFWLTLDPMDAKYSVPVRRKVSLSWDRKNGGFTLSTPQADDGMVDDASTDGSVGTGNLRMLLRRDTLIARANASTTGETTLPLLPNAQFTLTYWVNGSVAATQYIKTNDQGVAVLQAPITMEDGSQFPINQDVDVQITQTDGTHVDGYQDFTATGYLVYNSSLGYTVPATDPVTNKTTPPETNVDPQFDPDTGLPNTSGNGGLSYTQDSSKVVGVQYGYGGTQLIVPFTQESSVTLTAAPQVMNFGKASRSASDQSLSLVSTGDTSPNWADFDTTKLNSDAQTDGTITDDSSVDTTGAHYLKASVLQKGDYESGWQLKMAMSALTSQNDPEDTIPESYVSMAAPTVYRTTDSADTNSPTTDLHMGMAANTVYMTGSAPADGEIPDLTQNASAKDLVNSGTGTSAPGTYDIRWLTSGIKMHLPKLSGTLNTSYHSTISWDLVVAQ
ncbi:SpaA isopeptide-forming pilin-related protein [Lacticaseibacillus porcinae]|uniref:SpaA isopeptide-forming pilin-related protein n=1 Tax=Lacticaseibacillus porcinae TaxID=1123687 RepID=UPI000F789903|nr:SpaA isopeptide-forming pilin-related protein [Lacticaseibacillus porcinae]